MTEPLTLNSVRSIPDVVESPVAEKSAPDFSSMTKAQLLEYANENGIETVNGSMKKADILTEITGGTK